MILQSLAAYYYRLLAEGNPDIVPFGFERKKVPFVIVLDLHGQFVDLWDTREGEGGEKLSRLFTVPKGMKRSSNSLAHLLCDNPTYVLGYPENAANKNRHELFKTAITDMFPPPVKDAGIIAVLTFLRNGNFQSIYNHPAWAEIAEKEMTLSFKLKTDNILVCQRQPVIDAVTQTPPKDGIEGICLVTGEKDTIARTHTLIHGVRGAQTTGANLVSFQRHMGFDHYGKEQGYNAPIGVKAEFAYTTALNHLLLRCPKQKIQIGDATTVFWAEKKNQLEDLLLEILGYHPPTNLEDALDYHPPGTETVERDYQQLLDVFRSPRTGVEPQSLNPATKFYVLGLAPNYSRLAVRFWYVGTVGSLADNIYQHFDDLRMVKSESDWSRIDLYSLLRSTASQGDYKNVIPTLAGDTMRAILTGIPYPKTLLTTLLDRIHIEQHEKTNTGKTKRSVSYTRVALIKAILVRDTRCNHKNIKEVGMALDITNTNPGYLLGRLFAVLEKIQVRANHRELNATIRERFYIEASIRPAMVFPHLMVLANFHLKKIKNKGEVINYKKQMGEIISKLESASAFPAILTPEDQGRFHVGYYHQREEIYAKK